MNNKQKIFWYLWLKNGCSINQIHEDLGIHRSYVSKILKQLHSEKQITKRKKVYPGKKSGGKTYEIIYNVVGEIRNPHALITYEIISIPSNIKPEPLRRKKTILIYPRITYHQLYQPQRRQQQKQSKSFLKSLKDKLS